MRVTPEMIASLRGKYLEIKRLRDDHAAAREQGGAAGEPTHHPKREMAALARRFPGALRELDELPMTEIERRLAALDEALEKGIVPQWAALQLAYHGTFRAALRLKLLAGKARSADKTGPAALDAAAVVTVIRELRESAAPDEGVLIAEIDRDHGRDQAHAALASILRPAGGRLHPWVLTQVARIYGVSPEEVARSLFLRERALAPTAESHVPSFGPKS